MNPNGAAAEAKGQTEASIEHWQQRCAELRKQYLGKKSESEPQTAACVGGLLRVQPQRGKALIFAHRQLHEGAAVVRGRKYVLRSDVMYRQVTA